MSVAVSSVDSQPSGSLEVIAVSLPELDQLNQDIAALNLHPALSLDDALVYVHRKAKYKTSFKHGPHHNLYLTYRSLVKEVRQAHLPLRAVDYIRQGMKAGAAVYSYPDSLRSYVPSNVEPKHRKEVLEKLESEFIAQAKAHERAASLASKIAGFHGANSCIFACLPETDFTLLSTGALMRRGIAPPLGEISCGGMVKTGVNQSLLSCDVIERVSRCWEYASQTSHSFRAPDTEQFMQKFRQNLSRLKNITPDDDDWDPLLISFLRLKQWDFEMFQKLCSEHSNEIEQISERIVAKASKYEMLILRAADYPMEELIKALTDPGVKGNIEVEFGIHDSYIRKRLPTSKAGIQSGALGCIAGNAQEYLRGFNLHPVNASLICGYIFLFRLNADKELENFFLERNDPAKWSEIQENFPDMLDFLRDVQPPLSAEDILQLMIRDKIRARIHQNMKPFEQGWQRLKKIFSPEPPPLLFGPKQKQIIAHAYPLLMASTKCKPILSNSGSEYNLPQARLGVDIDVFFVPADHILETEEWLKEHHLDDQVTVYPSSLIKEMETLPRIHSAMQVFETEHSLTSQQQKRLNVLLNVHVFPLYRKPYPNGEPRKMHGVPHAARAVLFSHTFMELYHASGRKMHTEPGNLQIAVGLHDCARKEDNGEDLWDEESGKMCTVVLKAIKQKAEDEEADFLGRCIADKDKPAESPEQENTHDADAIEIIRCLYNPNDFNAEELRALKHIDRETIYQLIREAKRFIRLTEMPIIKSFLETTEQPYAALLQILEVTKRQYPLLARLNEGGIEVLANPANYLLPEEVEKVIFS